MNSKLIVGIAVLAMVLAVMAVPAMARTDDVVFYFNTSDGSHDITVAPGAEVTIYFDADAPVNTTGGHEMSVLFDPAVVECLDVTVNESVTDWMVWGFRGVHTATDPNLSYANFDALDFSGVGPGLVRCGDLNFKAVGPGETTLYLGLYSDDIPNIDHDTMICDVSGYAKDWIVSEPFTITCTGPSDIDNNTKEDIPVIGNVSGNHTLTHESDDLYESITENLSIGNPAKRRYSHLEHKWTTDVIDGSKANVTFYLEAHHSLSSDGDDFVFAYSANDDTYTDMVTVIKTDDNDTCQTYELPNDLSGTVYIRVKDTDQTAGNQGLDTVHIDQMFIRSVLAPPSYGVTVTIDEASQTVAPGNSTTYTVRVNNTGDLDASYSVVMGGTAVIENTIDVVPSEWITGTLAPNEEDVQNVMVSTNLSTTEMTYTLTATAICDQDAGVNDSATSNLVVSSATNTMHIASIDMSSKIGGPNRNAIALVTIVDAVGAPVENAFVEGHWSDATTDSDSGFTVNGVVALNSDKVKTVPATFTFTVDDVSLAGWTYDDAANVVDSGTITVP